MNINNFKNYINKTIVDIGYSYYIEGNVVEAFEQDENEYIFHIEGSDEYEVLVAIEDNGNILNSECDCPYDFGPVCKHEVAAYFQLYEMLTTFAWKEYKKLHLADPSREYYIFHTDHETIEVKEQKFIGVRRRLQ